MQRLLKEILSLFCLIRFVFTEYLFGFEIACNYLRTVNSDALIKILRGRGAKVGENCDIGYGLTVHNCKNFSNLIIAENCHVGKGCFFDLRNKITIGRGVVVSMNSSIITHLDMSKSVLSKRFPPTSREVQIRDDSYIGCGSVILMGVEIKSNSLVAAGSVVISDIEAFAVYGGVPAKFIKSID